MTPLTGRQGKIMDIIRLSQGISAHKIQEALGTVSLATVKRDISSLLAIGYIESRGKGRAGGYVLASQGKLFSPIDAALYCAEEPDERGALERYDQKLISELPTTLFTSNELLQLEAATFAYRTRVIAMSQTISKKEWERFIIELAWKSSRIEGNTYTLLDTERLIREGVEAPGHIHEEAVMILNHKHAFRFVWENKELFIGAPKLTAIAEVHRLLVKDLNVDTGIRNQVVGITGTRYRPLDNSYQITEALEDLLQAIGRSKDAYTAGLITILGLSYIQPFADGNKRTSRLAANAVLLARQCVPLSYRSTNEVAYREATLVFYETNSLAAFKEIFITQYFFAADQYGLK